MPKKTALEAIVVRFFVSAPLDKAISVLEIAKDVVRQRTPEVKRRPRAIKEVSGEAS